MFSSLKNFAHLFKSKQSNPKIEQSTINQTNPQQQSCLPPFPGQQQSYQQQQIKQTSVQQQSHNQAQSAGNINMVNQFPKDIKKLPSIELKSTLETNCCICLDLMKERDMVTELECSHTLHTECAKPCLKQNGYKYPECGSAILTDDNQDDESILTILSNGATSCVQTVGGLIGLLIGGTIILSSLGLPVLAGIYVDYLGRRAGFTTNGCAVTDNSPDNKANNEYRDKLKYDFEISHHFHWLACSGLLSIPLSIIYMSKATIDYLRI